MVYCLSDCLSHDFKHLLQLNGPFTELINNTLGLVQKQKLEPISTQKVELVQTQQTFKTQTQTKLVTFHSLVGATGDATLELFPVQ